MDIVAFKVSNYLSSLRCSLRCLLPRGGHHLSSPTKPPFLRAVCANSRSPISNSHRTLSSTSDSSMSMDVLKAVQKQASAACNSIAIRAEEKSYSHNQLFSSAMKISRHLLNETSRAMSGSLRPEVSVGDELLCGARIGIVAKPSAEFVAALLGTWLSGCVAVPLAVSHPEAELLHVMNDSDVAMILSTEDYSELMQNVAVKAAAQFSLIPLVSNDSSLTGKSDNNKGWPDNIGSLQRIEGDNPAIIIYTSGTTGKPKGVVHTHKSIAAQVQTLTEAWGYTSSDHFLNCLPLHHVHGLFNALLAPLFAGSTVEFMQKFSVRGIWQRWRESFPKNGIKADDAITVFTGVPTMYARLIQGYEAMDSELQSASASAASHLRLMMCGSSALPFPVMQQWEAITGHCLLERYGMTEFIMAISNPLSGKRKGGTVGKPLPGVQAKILVGEEDVNDETGVGELCIRSPSLFKEYWKLPEATKESFIDEGFFKTGDAAKVDEDGYYIILGRTSADIMKVGGYKLSALEIEAILLEHPSVSECCVLGLPDKDYGEEVCAIIVPDTNARKIWDEELKPAISLEELRSWAKDKLAPYKLPTRLFLWGSLPRNAMGKVNKKELKKQLSAKVN